MSSAKFAAITASLLARKGDAAPSVVVPVMTPPPRRTLVRRDEKPFRSERHQPEQLEKRRRIMILVTQEELEKLSIAAIKKGATRHDIVRGALDDYFRKLSAELPRACACIESGPAAPALEHDPEKPCPGLDPEWTPVFGKDHAQMTS